MFTQMFYEPDQGSTTDDTGVNGMEVMCRGPGMSGTLTENIEQKMGFTTSEWTSWSPNCPSGAAVCALKTKVEPDQGTSLGVLDYSDDGALTDAKLYCCYY